MTFLKSALVKGVLTATIAGGALVGAATTASADVACNRYGECWHVSDRYDYPPTLGIRFHTDRWGYSHRHYGYYHWRRDHDRDDDRGYWRNGVWITF